MTNYDETRPAEMGAPILPPAGTTYGNAKCVKWDKDEEPKTMPVLAPGDYRHVGAEVVAGGEAFWEYLEANYRIEDPEWVAEDINGLVEMSHGMSYHCGWWHDRKTKELLTDPLHIPAKIALIHSEISEALEADRKDAMDDKLPHRLGIEVELADALHRIFDLAGALGLDLGGAYVEKCKYNAHRADHKQENRAETGGKAY